MSKYYITTPIYYVNDVPHVGHLYTSVAADTLAIYRRLRGDDVVLLTGTDENSQKNIEASLKHGYTDIQAYLDMMSARWKTTFAELGITFTDFIRTTEKRHHVAVEKFWRAVEKSGDIYVGDYEGLYCKGCELFIIEADLVDGKCAIHKTVPEKIKEKNYFFRLSAYREKILAHIDANPDFIQPQSRRNEIRSYVDKFMTDTSISRESMKWGIPVPGDEKSVIYVWFDALINYLTAVGYGSDDAMFAKYWPADVHLVGKDIIKFHCALWPAMLMSAGLPLPKKVFANGFLTIDGHKMSKSLGNVISPVDAAAPYGIEPLRFFLLREVTFGGDGDFSMKRLGERYGSDLANEFGNLLFRTLSMTEKYFEGKVPTATAEDLTKEWSTYETAMDALDFGGALDVIWGIFREGNRYIDDNKPWDLAKTDRAKLASVLYHLLERLRHGALMLRPFMPKTSAEALRQLGVSDEKQAVPWEEAKIWGALREGDTIAKGTPLFPRIENPQ